MSHTPDGGLGDKTIAVDLDGTLHAYSKGWHDGTMYDGPMPGAYEAIASLRQQGFDVVIFTARTIDDEVRDWILSHLGWAVPVTNQKPIAALYIDDRAIHFRTWDQALCDLIVRLGR